MEWNGRTDGRTDLRVEAGKRLHAVQYVHVRPQPQRPVVEHIGCPLVRTHRVEALLHPEELGARARRCDAGGARA